MRRPMFFRTRSAAASTTHMARPPAVVSLEEGASEMAATTQQVEGVEVHGTLEPGFEQILTPEALAFVAGLQREVGATREALLARRAERQREIDAGATPDFLTETKHVREDPS